MEDRRNWKCLFGMHQFAEHQKPVETRVFESPSSSKPFKRYMTYTMKCDFCGKIISERVEL